MFNPIIKTQKFNDIKEALLENSSRVYLCNLTENSKIHIMSSFTNYKKLIVARDEKRAKQIYEDLCFYADKKNMPKYYLEKDLLFGKASANIKEFDKNRVLVLEDILQKEYSTTIITAQSLMEKIQSKNIFTDKIQQLEVGKEINFELFIKTLNDLHYERVYEVENYGEFAVRGGIVDIYLYNYENPIRIDFFGDEITSIKFFNIDTKRSTENLQQIKIYNLIDEKDINSSILSYFDKQKTLVIIDEEKEVYDKFKLVEDMLTENIIRRKEENINSDELQIIDTYSCIETINSLNDYKKLYLNSFDVNIENEYEKYDSDDNKNKPSYTFDFSVTSPSFNKNDFQDIIKVLKQYLDNKYCGIIAINSKTKIDRILEDLQDNGIKAFISSNNNEEIKEGYIQLVNGNLDRGFIYENEKFFIFSENDLFNVHIEKKKHNLKFKEDDKYKKIEKISQLKIGDYVVHISYGIGIYKGIKTLENNNVKTEYMVIEYVDGGILYIPCTNLEVVMKYQSSEGKKPHLNKLNSLEWEKTKTKVKKEIEEMAKDLIELYATRYKKVGYTFSADNIWQKEFEETFPYEETFDQIQAIELTKKDMESSKCMDRLICGDVGFGKTEVALRAAFKAVQDSKQVCYLAPTTILCQQQYNTFSQRMLSFPITVDYLSRFKTTKQIKQTIEKLKSGDIDIIIGTHRLLSNDIAFKDLGLLIIDEEQRFGVTHKEKIKKLKTNVDVLSMSATPIPRTLHMSLTGIRDLSLLTEAPPERVPIQTYVLEYNKELVREAIERELKRKGQIFYVHNRVSDIFEVASEIQNMFPDAKVAIAHGKMSENELEDVMNDFIKGDANILVSTTIIETGIDIPNANTLIVDNADRFGISQLYQLRGRIGRSNREAYSFFMYKKGKFLTEEQGKRLKAIKEFSSLGSGIKIAMRDLEIRGAGNVLGISQSGHIDAIGYEMYFKLLNNAMKYLETDDVIEKVKTEFDVSIFVDIDAYIPTFYIESEDEKINMYKKISLLENDEEIEILKEELEERFGKLTKEVKNLLYIAKLKIKCKKCFVTELKVKPDFISMIFHKNAKIKNEELLKLLSEYPKDMKFVNTEMPTLMYKSSMQIKQSCERTLLFVEKILDKIEA